MPVAGEMQPEVIRPRIFGHRGPIIAGFSTRRGGVSSSPFASLNLGYSSGDDRSTVTENRRRLFMSIRIDPDQLALAYQVHGTDVATVDAPGAYPGHDALVTKRPDICLCIVAADCACVLLADPDAGVVGAAHAGWRGAAGGIVSNTLEHMARLGAKNERVAAYVSPCISPVHFEVGPEVAQQFKPAYVMDSETTSNKFFVDLPGAISDQLISSGILREHIEISDECTFANTLKFYSHRAERGRTGRMMGFIMRKSTPFSFSRDLERKDSAR